MRHHTADADLEMVAQVVRWMRAASTREDVQAIPERLQAVFPEASESDIKRNISDAANRLIDQHS